MRKVVLAFGLLSLAGCYGGERSEQLSQAVVVKNGPDVSVNESTNTICVTGDIAGLGHDNLDVDIQATFAATTVCRNHGGQTAPGQGTVPLSITFPTQSFEPDKNGRVRFRACTDPVEGSDYPVPSSQEARCPNGNWTVDPIQTSAITIASYSIDISHRGEPIYAASGP